MIRATDLVVLDDQRALRSPHILRGLKRGHALIRLLGSEALLGEGLSVDRPRGLGDLDGRDRPI